MGGREGGRGRERGREEEGRGGREGWREGGKRVGRGSGGRGESECVSYSNQKSSVQELVRRMTGNSRHHVLINIMTSQAFPYQIQLQIPKSPKVASTCSAHAQVHH